MNSTLLRIGLAPLLLALVLLGWPDTGRTRDIPEYQLKAAFLFNAAKFVDWPPEALSPEVFTIGVLGEDPFGPALDVLATRTIKGKKIVIRRVSSLDRVRDCQLLFIASSELRRLPAVLSTLRQVPALTISDIDGFASGGGMLEMVMDQGRLGFIANNRQARKQGLKISAQMLKLAREIIE